MKKFISTYILVFTIAIVFAQRPGLYYPCLDANNQAIEGCVAISQIDGRFLYAKVDTSYCTGTNRIRKWVSAYSGATVFRDTLNGDCQSVSGDDWGSQTIVSDGSLLGNGTTGNALSVVQSNILYNNLDFTGTTGLSDGIDNVDDADASITNEIELPPNGSNGDLLQTNGSGTYSWTAPTSGESTTVSDSPRISHTLTGSDISSDLISGSITPGYLDRTYLETEVDGSISNELQTISKSGSTVTLSDGGGSFTDAVNDADASPTNEIELPVGGTNGDVLINGPAWHDMQSPWTISGSQQSYGKTTFLISSKIARAGQTYFGGNDASTMPTSTSLDVQGNINFNGPHDFLNGTTNSLISGTPLFGSLDNNLDNCSNCWVLNGYGNLIKNTESSFLGFTSTGDIDNMEFTVSLGSDNPQLTATGSNRAFNASIGGTNPVITNVSSSVTIGGTGPVITGEVATTLGGVSVKARSFAEVVTGVWPTDYTADSNSSIDADDRLFNIGNGTTQGSESDAFTILKNGNIGLGVDNFEAFALNSRPLSHSSGAYLDGGGVWTNASDRNKKFKIKNISTKDAYKVIEKLKPRSYYYYYGYKNSDIAQGIGRKKLITKEIKHDYQVSEIDKDYGFIAQEVEEILPEIVSGVEGLKAMNYNAIIPMLVKVIQDLNERIDKLEKRSK